jgi:hypothetical protein
MEKAYGMTPKSSSYSASSRSSFHRTPMEYTQADVDVPMATIITDYDAVNEKTQSHPHHTGSEHAGANTHNIKQWPAPLRDKLIQTFKRPCDERRAGALLQTYDWPEGLKATVYKSCKKIPLRFFIVDDSGKMMLITSHVFYNCGDHAMSLRRFNDIERWKEDRSARWGHEVSSRYILTHAFVRLNGCPLHCLRVVKCTRWAELTETMLFLAELSEALRAPSEFRLLNGADPIIVGMGDDHGESLKFLKEVLPVDSYALAMTAWFSGCLVLALNGDNLLHWRGIGEQLSAELSHTKCAVDIST